MQTDGPVATTSRTLSVEHRARHGGVLQREGSAEAAAALGLRAARRGRCPRHAAAAAAVGRRPAASAASGRSGGRSPGAGTTRRRPRRPSTSTSSSDSSYVRAASARASARPAPCRRRARRPRRAGAGPSPTHDPLGATTTSTPSKARRGCATSGRASVGIAGVDVHLAAAGLGLRDDDLVAEALEQSHGRATHRREHRVDEAGDEQRDAHAGSVARRVRSGSPRACLARVPAVAWRSPRTSPCARAWTSRLPSAVASTGPA